MIKYINIRTHDKHVIFYLVLIQNKQNTIDTNKSGGGQHGNTVYPSPSRFDRTT